MAHPNSLANLRPWKPGQAPPPPGPKKVEQALKIAQQSCPKAARLIARCISDPELPISTRLRCAEFVLDKALPTQKSGISGILEGSGLEFLELRFVAPGQQPESHRVPLIEAEASDISDLDDSAEDASDG